MRTILVITLFAAIAATMAGCRGPNADEFNCLGLQHFRAGDFESAQAAFHEAAMVDPTNGDYYFNLGAAQQARGRIDDAIISYRTATRIDPSLIDAHHNMALCYLARNDTAEAERAWKRMCNLNPVNARPFYLFAEYWQKNGDRFQERRCLENAVTADSRDIEARYRLYKFMERQGEADKAAHHYRAYLELKAKAAEEAEQATEAATVKPSRSTFSSQLQ